MSSAKSPSPTAAERAVVLRRYIYLLTSNEKRFPKRYRQTMTYKIESLSDMMVTEIRIGDEIYPSTKASYDSKITHYKEALAIIRTLGTHLEDVREMPYFNLSGNQVSNISRDLASCTNMLTRLIKKTKERFPKYDDERKKDAAQKV